MLIPPDSVVVSHHFRKRSHSRIAVREIMQNKILLVYINSNANLIRDNFSPVPGNFYYVK